MSPDKISEFLKRIPELPDSAAVPVAVAAAHDGVCEKTVKRSYPTVQLSPNRKGVRVGHLRNRQETTP